MPQIGPAKIAARVASATLIDRGKILLVLRLLDFDLAKLGKKHAIARVAGGHHAVKHINTQIDAGHQIFGSAHTHQVARFVFGHVRRELVYGFVHQIVGFANRKPADCKALKGAFLIAFNLQQSLQTLFSQIVFGATLHNGK